MHDTPSSRIAAILAALLIAGCGGGGSGGIAFPLLPAPEPSPPPEPTVEVGGAVDSPASYTVAELAARPATTMAVTYASGSGEQTRTYTGANLWSLLSDSGLQTDPSRRNDLNSRYVLATGSDGYRAVFSLGELDPSLGNRESLVAYATVIDGQSQPLPESDGPFRVTAPGDVKGGRYVSNLIRLDVRASGATAEGSGGGLSPSFRVSGAVLTEASFDIDALRGLAATTVTVGTDEYKGVSLWALLDHLKLRLPEDIKNPTLSMYAVATATDNYRALLSLGEVDPGFGNNGTIVAYEINGQELDRNGMARLVVPGDLRRSRSVSNLIAIEVLVAEGP